MIPGLLNKIQGATVDTLQFYSIEPADAGLLAQTSIIADLVSSNDISHPWKTVPRAGFHTLIVKEAEELYGVPIYYDKNVVGIEQGEDEGEESVKVLFADGGSDTGSFVVGCDGLHSRTRIALFGKEQAHYTGMIQVRVSVQIRMIVISYLWLSRWADKAQIQRTERY